MIFRGSIHCRLFKCSNADSLGILELRCFGFPQLPDVFTLQIRMSLLRACVG
jgi:hypothetical protein